MFLEARCFMCNCVKLPSYGNFTVGSHYIFEYLIDAEKVTDDLGNEITFSENMFKIFFENLGEAITTYSPMLMDHTVYSISLILHDRIPTLEEIKAYAKIMNKNYLQAKKALVYKKNLLVSGNACDIGEVLKKLNAFQVQYEIEPSFPFDELLVENNAHDGAGKY